jgi:hypothetical protein
LNGMVKSLRHEALTSNALCIQAQAEEIRQLKASFQRLLETRSERKKAKLDHKVQMRKTKRRDLTIEEQEQASRATVRVKETLAFKRATFDATMEHTEQAHEKQRKQLTSAQERKMAYEKMVHEMQIRHMNEVLRSTESKKFQVRVTHQMSLNKHVSEQLHTLQQLEVKHLKDRFDMDILCFEELEDYRIASVQRVNELKAQQATELYAEKDRIIATKEAEKLDKLKHKHSRDLKFQSQQHRVAVRNIKLVHEGKVANKRGKASAKRDGSESPHSPGRSVQASVQGSRIQSRMGSGDSINSDMDNDLGSHASGMSRNSHISAGATMSLMNHKGEVGRMGLTEENEEEGEGDEMAAGRSSTLTALSRNHRKALETLQAHIKEELVRIEQTNVQKTKELEEDQSAERDALVALQLEEHEHMRAFQEKEIEMEAAVHDAEMKMLLERRILNSVLETVVDGGWIAFQ